MADVEKFSWGKFFGGFLNIVSWMKDIKTICVIIILAFLGFTVYRAYFVKTQTQKNTQIINAAAGSNVHVAAPQQIIQQGRKWSTGPFIGVTGSSNDNGVFAGWVLLYNF